MPPISWSRRWNGPTAGCWTPKTLLSSRTTLLCNSTSALEIQKVGLAEEEVRDDPLLLAGASRQVIIGPLHVRLSKGAREGTEDLNLDLQARLTAFTREEELDLVVGRLERAVELSAGDPNAVLVDHAPDLPVLPELPTQERTKHRGPFPQPPRSPHRKRLVGEAAVERRPRRDPSPSGGAVFDGAKRLTATVVDVECVQTHLQLLLPPLLDLARELALQVPLGVSHSRRVVSEKADVAVDLRHPNQLL